MAVIFDIGLKLNDSELKQHLQSVRGDIERAFNINPGGKITKELAAATTQAIALEKALSKATTDKGISYSSLTLELQKSGTSAARLTSTLASGGTQFAASLNSANSALALSNRQVLSLNKTLQEAGRVFKQSFKFTVAQTVIRSISTEIRQTVTWVKELNDAVNNIAVVTGKSAQEVEKVTRSVIKGSADLRVAAKDYAEGALIFYQQGLNDEEVTRRNQITIKASKAANQSIQEMSQQLTAIWNTYGMVGQEQERAAAVGAKMAASTAVDFKDIATAMQQVAAPAAQMGVEYNQLAAIIATVGDVTQQSASTIGNAYKTIFSRFQQLKAEGTDGEVTLSSVSQQLQALGVHVIDAEGNLRNLGTVINEVGQNWDNWTQTQQTAIAQIVGGTRQYGQFLALMENFDKYQKNLNLAALEDGSTLEQQYEQALDSIESRAENAGEAWKRAFSEVINADQLKTFYGVLEEIGELVGGILKSLGGAPGILTILIGLLSKQLIPLAGQAGTAISTLWSNRNADSRKAAIEKDFGQSQRAISSNSQLSQTEKNVALQKNEFSKTTALINEQINTALKTATGEYKVQLEMYKQLLTVAQERYQAALDEETVAQRGVTAHQKALDILRESLVVAQQLSDAELRSANETLDKAQRDFNAQNAQVSAARGLVNGAQRDVDAAQRTVDTSASEQSRAANEEKLTQARQRLAEATALLAQEEQKLTDAQKKLEAAQAAVNDAKVTKNLKDQHLAANQLVKDYDSMAQKLAQFDQGEISIDELKLALDQVVISMKELNKTAAGEETAGMREDFQALGTDIDNVTDRGEELEQVLRDLAELKQALAGGLDLDLQTGAADESLEAHDRLEQARQRQDRAGRESGNPPPPPGDDNNPQKAGAKEIAESVAALASMAAALTTVINTLKTLKSIWFEENDASIIEKIGMTITAVGGLLMGIVPVISLIGNEAVMTALKINTALGPLGLVILGITAALVGVIAVIGLIADAVKKASPEYKLQKAKEEAKAFEDALKDAKDEATALQEAFNKYDEVQNALKDCTRGTQEWRDALKAANDQVLEMLGTYPELSKYISKDADGLLTISEEGQNLLQARANQKVIDTQAALSLSNQNVRDKQLAVSKNNLMKDYSGALSATRTYSYDDGSGDTQQLSQYGSQLSSVINKYLKDILSSGDLSETVQDIFNKENLQGDVDEWVAELQRMIPDLQDLDAEILAATEAKRIENDQIAESVIQNNKRLDGIKDNDAMAAGGRIYSGLTDKYYEEELRKAKSRTGFNAGTADSKASFAEYAKGMGLDVLDGFKVTNYKGSGDNASVVYEYIDEEGKKQTGEATAEMIARFNAAAKAGEDLTNAMVKLNAEVENLNIPDEFGGDAGDRALSSFLANGNLEGATQGEFNDIKSDVSEFDSAEAYLKSKFGDDLTEIAEIAGYNSVEAFVSAFEDGLEIDWNSIPEGLQKYESLNLAQAKRMAEVYKTAMADGGEEAAKAYTDGLDYILKDVSNKDMEKVLDQLSYIDWSNWDAGKDVVTVMEALGYTVDTTTQEWDDFTNAMRDSFDAVPDIEALNQQLQQLEETAADISVGDIISEEDYKNLAAFNSELTKYFAILSDGSAQFIGDPLDFKQAVQETGKKALMDAARELQDTASEAQAQYDAALRAAGGSKEGLQSLRQSQNRVVVNEETGESSNQYWVGDVAKQIAFLEQMDFDTEKIEEWKKAITLDENGEYNTTVEVLEQIGNAVDEMAPKWQKAGESAEIYQQQVQGIANQIAMQAESFEQLEADLGKLGLTQEQYNVALGAGTAKLINAERWEGLDAGEVEKYAKHLQNAATKSDMLADSLEDDEEAAEDVARATKKLNRGIDNLANGFEDWSSILEDSDASSEEYCEALDGMKDAMSDILDISEDFLSDDFILKNMDDIKLAAEGDADAIDRLRQAALEDIVLNLELDGDLTNEELWGKVQELQAELDEMFPDGIEIGTSIDLNGLDEGEAGFIDKLNALILEAGMSADQVNAMLSGMGFTANFASEPQKVEIREPDKTITHHSIQNKRVVTMEDGSTAVEWDDVTTTETEPGEVHEGEVDAYSLETSEPGTTVIPKIQSLTKTGSGAMNNYSSSNRGGTKTPGGKSKSGGGGSSSKTPVKKVDKTKKEDKQRYIDNENAIEDVTNALDRLSKANDHAFGPQKIRNINLMNVQLARQAKAYQALYNEAKMYTQLDAMSLDSGLTAFNTKYGTSLKAIYDGDNLLDNEMALLNAITDLRNEKIAEINKKEDMLNQWATEGVLQDDPKVEKLNEELDALKDNLSTLDTDVEDMVKKNLENYQEAIRKAEETMQAMVDILYQGLANEIEKYTIARDLHIEINELEQKHWEAVMDNMGAVGKLGKQVASMLKKSLGSINDSVDRYIKHYAQMEDVQKRWENRDITLKAEYGITDEVWDRAQQSGMIPQEIMDEFKGDIDALMDLRQQVWDNLDQQWQNYIDTIQHYIDEYDRITDRLDKQASISDNLMHIIETVGFNYKWGADESKSYYKNMEKQLDIVKNKAAAVNGELAVATNRRKEAEEELDKLLAGRSVMEFSNSANEAEMFEYNRIKEHYDEMADLEAELNAQRIELLAEAYDKATEYAEQWGEIIAHEADEALRGAFDTLDEAMDMYNQKRDIDTFFMDDVDKAFELNKLKKEIEDVIDDISDPEQLERYNKLLAEIEAKKEAGVKMTEKDLEILRAQFDLEQARDAYQDARNAKNTMRLARDASGNYTYVYSGDEASIEDQEAKVEEALHNIYKLNRDAADEYAETWLQLQVDWENYYKSIDQARYEQDVKYRDMVDQRMKWYAEQSDLLSNEIIKHNDAIDRSFTDMTLSVITNTEDMASTNDMYKEHHTELKEKLVQNYQEWIEKADETMREVGGSMSDLEQVVDEETDKMMTEVDNLREEIDRLNVEAQSALSDLAGFIGTWCADVNREFDTVIAEIDRLIAKYKELLATMAQQADAAIADSSHNYDNDISAAAAVAYRKSGYSGTFEEWLETDQGRSYQDLRINYIVNDPRREEIGYNPEDYQGESGRDKNKQEMIDANNRIGDINADKININFRGDGDLIINDDGSYSYKGQTATGGLIKTPQVRSLAEEGPELVLNNVDTENILNAVKAIRGVVQSQIGAVELGMLGKTGRIAEITPSVTKAETQSIDQTVHIDASFPGVSAAAEIETALNNLIVQAAHYSLNNKQN